MLTLIDTRPSPDTIAPGGERLNAPQAIAVQAEKLAHAEARLAAASAALADAEAAHRQAADRLAALNGEKAAIAQRRAAGQHEAEDGARLALLAADAETLAAIMGETRVALDAATARADRERHMAAVARQHLAMAEDQAALPLLLAHAHELGRLLMVAVGEVAAVEGRLGHRGRPAWAPTRSLYEVMRRHAAAHGLL